MTKTTKKSHVSVAFTAFRECLEVNACCGAPWDEVVHLEDPKSWKTGQTHLFESTDTRPLYPALTPTITLMR